MPILGAGYLSLQVEFVPDWTERDTVTCSKRFMDYLYFLSSSTKPERYWLQVLVGQKTIWL